MDIIRKIVERVRATPTCRRLEFQARSLGGTTFSSVRPYRWWLLPALLAVFVFVRLYSVTEEVLLQGSIILLHFVRWPLTGEQFGSVNVMGGIILLIVFCGAGFLAFVHFLPKLREHLLEAHFNTPVMQAVFKHFVQQALEQSVFMFTVRQALVVLMTVALPPLVACPHDFATLGWLRFHGERAVVLLMYATASLVMYGISVRLLMLPSDLVGHRVMSAAARCFLYISVAMLRIYPALNAAGYPLSAILLHLTMRYPFVLLALGFLSIEPVDMFGAYIRREYDVTFSSMAGVSALALTFTAWSSAVGYNIALAFIEQGEQEPWPELWFFVSIGVRLFILLLCVAVLVLYSIGLHAVYGGMPLLACEFSQPRVHTVRFKHGAIIVPKIQRLYSNYMAQYVTELMQHVLTPAVASASAAGASGFTLSSLGEVVTRMTSGAAPATTPVVMMSAAASAAAGEEEAQEDPPDATPVEDSEPPPGLPRSVSTATTASAASTAAGSSSHGLLRGVRDIIDLALTMRSMLNGRPFSVEMEGHVHVINVEQQPMVMTPANINVEIAMAPVAQNYLQGAIQEAQMRRTMVVAVRGFTVPPAGPDGPFEGDIPVAVTVFLHVNALYAVLQSVQAGWSIHSLYAELRLTSRLLKGFNFSVPLLSWLNRTWTGIGMLDPARKGSSAKSVRQWNAKLVGFTEDLAQRRVNTLLAEMKKLPEAAYPNMYRLLLMLVHLNRRSNPAGQAAAAAYEMLDAHGLQAAQIAQMQLHAETVKRLAAAVGEGDAGVAVPAYDHDDTFLVDDMEADAFTDMMDVTIAVQLIIDIRLQVGQDANVSPLLVETAVTLLNYFYSRISASFQAGASPMQLLLFTGIMTCLQGIMLPTTVPGLVNLPATRPQTSREPSQDPPQSIVNESPPPQDGEDDGGFFVTQGFLPRPRNVLPAVSTDPAPIYTPTPYADMPPALVAEDPLHRPVARAFSTPPRTVTPAATAAAAAHARVFNPFDSPDIVAAVPPVAVPPLPDLFAGMFQNLALPSSSAVQANPSAAGIRHRPPPGHTGELHKEAVDTDDLREFTTTPPRPPPYAPPTGSPGHAYASVVMGTIPSTWTSVSTAATQWQQQS